jgi:hypothetical protein
VALPAEPPRYVPKPGVGVFHSDPGGIFEPIHRGRSGWPVYSLQRAVGVTPATGSFGSVTLKKAKAFQAKYGLTVDGIAGPATQEMILQLAGKQADEAQGLPVGVGFGFAEAEGGRVLAATNWDVPDAVDCGPAQWRIKGPPFSLAKLKDAFRPYVALDHACEVLANRQRDFKQRNHHFTDDEALRVGVLAHNAPYGGMADTIVENYPGGGSWWRYVSRPDERAGPGEVWPPGGMTRAEWAKEYPARVLRFVA